MRRVWMLGVFALIGGCLSLTAALWKSKSASLASTDKREALLQADRDFDKATAEKGVEGWVSYFAEDGMMFPAGENIIRGKAAIREAMTRSFATPGYSLRWQPTDAEVSRAGDLGYTYGTYVGKSTDREGKPVTRYGKYVTIWKKQADGSWKIVLDVGNASPPPHRAVALS